MYFDESPELSADDEKTHDMYILVISARADNEVYDLAGKRK